MSESSSAKIEDNLSKHDENDIAIIGMSCSLPNAKDIEHLKKLTTIDGPSPEEQAVLKAAYSGQKLNPEQIAIIKQLTYKL